MKVIILLVAILPVKRVEFASAALAIRNLQLGLGIDILVDAFKQAVVMQVFLFQLQGTVRLYIRFC